MIKLSAPGKMPCKSWSLQAIDTCPGAKAPDGSLVPACRGCYATDGKYRIKNVRNVREHNRADWRRADWCDDMVSALESEPYFRWFDSGDMYHLGLATKIAEVISRTPWCQHWLPTRQHKFEKYKTVIAFMESMPNCVVRRSSDCIHGTILAGKTTSTIYDPESQPVPSGAIACEAYTRGGKCADCRACWDSDVPVIAYPQHGRKMRAVNIDILARG